MYKGMKQTRVKEGQNYWSEIREFLVNKQQYRRPSKLSHDITTSSFVFKAQTPSNTQNHCLNLDLTLE